MARPVNTVNDLVAELTEQVAGYDADRVRLLRQPASDDDVIDAAAMSTVVRLLDQVIAKLRAVGPDPALFIERDGGGDWALWRDNPNRPDLPDLILYQRRNEDAWDLLVEGRFPVREAS